MARRLTRHAVMDFRFLSTLGMTGRRGRNVATSPFCLPLSAQRERGTEKGLAPSLQIGYCLAVDDLVSGGDVDFLHDARPVGPERLLHLHRFEDADRVSRHDLIADLDGDGHDDAGHRRLERP